MVFFVFLIVWVNIVVVYGGGFLLVICVYGYWDISVVFFDFVEGSKEFGFGCWNFKF